MAVKGEGRGGERRGGKDSAQTALLSRRSTMGCESEEKKRREEREKEIGMLRKGQCVEAFF